jgi:putative PIN family toxin of toxin-antitoxin system
VKLVLDTNVVVSALLKPMSKPARILRLVLQGDIDIVINEHILAEYYEVHGRPKFALDMDYVNLILAFFRQSAVQAPAMAEPLQLPDMDDVPFLEAALSSRVDALVTGNKKHFPARKCKGIRILSPAECLTSPEMPPPLSY